MKIKSSFSFNQLILMFLEELDIKESSRKNYKTTLRVFTRWLVTAKIDVRSPTRANIIAYKSYLKSLNLAATTLDNYLSSVRQLFAWMERRGFYENIAAGVHSPKRYKGFRKEYLQEQEVFHLLKSIKLQRVIDYRDLAIIALMVTMGLRSIEVCRLDVEDVQMGNNGFKLRVWGKGRDEKDRVIGSVPDFVMDYFNDYLLQRKHTGKSPLFVTHKGNRLNTMALSRIIKKRLETAQLKRPGVTMHSFRHTAGITAIRHGADLQAVKEMLGHSSIDTTMIYLSAIEREKTLSNSAIQTLGNTFNLRARKKQENAYSRP